ncbi:MULTISPECIES: hypothetical protein [Bacillales]|uniref:hypothetical protein n=1 Tax=Bacillales TaxID=1385 RepID=UPI0003486238|nr:MULTISPECIES: hypothetical protein [Bacillales]KMZ42487.1 hypothetical protein AC624_15905 [Bacillus sp. FJAT-27238]NRS51752.1 hypothetical protein [Brevibacillus sp. HB2.2]
MYKKLKVFLLLSVVSIAGCTTSNNASSMQASPQPQSVDYNKKLEILDRLENHDTTLSRMTEILTIEWHHLFTQKNEEDLWNTYFYLTWNLRPDEKELVKKELSTNHKELATYLEMQKKGILPAKEVHVKNIMAERNPNNDGYLVKAGYLLTLNDGSSKEIWVELNADDNMETFNPRFNTIATGENLPEPKNEQERLRRDFILRALDYNVIKKMTYDEILEMIDMKSVDTK